MTSSPLKVVGISLDGEMSGGVSTRTPEALLAEEDGCCDVGTMEDIRLQADVVRSEDVARARKGFSSRSPRCSKERNGDLVLILEAEKCGGDRSW